MNLGWRSRNPWWEFQLYFLYIILRMIDNKPEESTNQSPKPRNSRRPETNGTANPAAECLRENNAQSCTKVPEHVPVSFVEHVRTEETNCFGKESSTTCTSLRIWLGWTIFQNRRYCRKFYFGFKVRQVFTDEVGPMAVQVVEVTDRVFHRNQNFSWLRLYRV